MQGGGRCAIESCRRELLADGAEGGDPAALGKIAHIVAASPDGPRGSADPPGAERHGSANLLLLCPSCHELIDRQPATYTVERLVGIKAVHEAWVRERLSPDEAEPPTEPFVTDTVHSTLLAVDKLPEHVYLAPTRLDEGEIRPLIREQSDPEIVLPYIVRAGLLITFTPLIGEDHPFADVVSEPGAAERHDAAAWWADADLSRWYVTLLNRTLNKLTGRRGLHLDKEHHRYYFEPLRDAEGKPLARTETYRPLNRDEATRNVVWCPIRKQTKAHKNYWIHLGVGLRFLRVAPSEWVLAVRPEVRFTRDGTEPLFPKTIGRRATSLKAHMYNYDLLGELQFWREYLSDGQPRIILDFGGPTLMIDAELRSGTVEWPGVRGDARPFDNVVRGDDLFTSAAYYRALEATADLPDAELEFWELQHLAALDESSHAETEL